MYVINFHKNVVKFINSRSSKEKETIKSKFELLKNNPYPVNEQLDIKKLTNTTFYRLRINSYRFIYSIEDTELMIYIEKAGNRGDIY